MKHRDRVQAALAREATDRCPIQVSFTPEFAERLWDEIGRRGGKQHNPHGGGNTYELERRLDQDLLLTSVGWANCYYRSFTPGSEYRDEWGVGWRATPYQTRFGQGIYTEIVGHPLADDEAIERYQAPDPANPELYAEAERVIREFKDEYWIVGVTVTTIWETAWALRGLERLLMDLVLDRERAERILDIPNRFHLAAAQKLVELGVDMIWIGDDVGTQQSMLIAPELWREILKPRLARFIRTLKEINPEVKVAYHSDGNVLPIISDLIEIGLDILNPIQPRCMDPAKVKQEFGDKLCFWGTIDEQHTLPFGRPEDVRQEVADRLATVGRGGGLIIGPTHHVQLDTPMENFRAMMESFGVEAQL
jgi:uroporphyrinogen decarboxylase